VQDAVPFALPEEEWQQGAENMVRIGAKKSNEKQGLYMNNMGMGQNPGT
jgi:hypothetical protein